MIIFSEEISKMCKRLLLKYLIILLLPVLLSSSCNRQTATNLKPATAQAGNGFQIQGLAVSAPPQKMDSSVFGAMQYVHANSIAVIPYAFCKMPDATVQFNHSKQWWGETDEGVKETVRMAQQNNMTVMLKPHLWIANGSYTGDIFLNDSAQAKRFETSYTEYILHFARIAEVAKVPIFCVGTELGGVVSSRPNYFPDLIAELRKIYSGKLTYAGNWDDYKKFPSWKLLDFIGVDAYFPLSDENEPSFEAMVNKWTIVKQELKEIHLSNEKPILFTEYGYRNADANAKEPWKEDIQIQNDANQVKALEALYSSFQNETWFAGGYLWKWYVDKRQLSFNRTIDFTPQGKPALETVKKWYKGN